MDEQTRKLLEECSSRCKMAVNSMEQVSEYIKDTKLKELADSFTEKLRELEAETAVLLNDAGNDEKATGISLSPPSYNDRKTLRTRTLRLYIPGHFFSILTCGSTPTI